MSEGSSSVIQTGPSLGLILSDDSDGDVPLLAKMKKNPNRRGLLVDSPKDVSMDNSPTVEGLDLGYMEGYLEKQSIDANLKDNESHKKGDKVVLRKEDQTVSPSNGKVAIAPEAALAITRPQGEARMTSPTINQRSRSEVQHSITLNTTSHPYPAGQNQGPQEDTSMDVDETNPLPNHVEFIRSALSDSVISPTTPIDTSTWEPIRLGLQSKAGVDWLCQGRLQNVTQEFEPPGFKWIRKKDFEVKSLRAVSQLPILRYNCRPSQHAVFAGTERKDHDVLSAFTLYLSQNNLCGIADTGYPESKLCFYPSEPSFAASFLSVPKDTPLRLGPLHLLVTILHLGRGKPPLHPSPSLKNRPQYEAFGFDSKLGSPWIQRGLRVLNFPDDLKVFLKQRPGGAYTLFTLENSNFRTNPSSKIEEKPPIQQTFEQGVYHREETLALISIMTGLQYISKPVQYGDPNIVFIHNAAWDILKHFPGFTNRKTRSKVSFYAYGPYHALHPKLWGVREIFKRGGVLTFTTRGILENPGRFQMILDCIAKSDVWMACISPLVPFRCTGRNQIRKARTDIHTTESLED
ncbi:hypothetical protein CPB86DRAFT_610393 [Serendipita vermifera]|nr:hypothetical protein CPB86DRAFT_610393 [Serendipita vermifera]